MREPLALPCVLMPLAAVVAVDPAGWFPFGPAKWAAVSVAAALLLIAVGRTRPWRVPRVPLALWGALLVLLAVAAAVGRDPWYAWIGTPERHLGVLTWLFFLGAFIAGFQLARAAIDTFVRGVALGAVFTGGYAVLEYVWRAPIAVATSSSRLGGPFGSPAYLGAATCLFVPITAGLAADRRASPTWRVAGALGALSCGVAVLGSGTRAAWLGLAAAAVLAVILRRPAVADARRMSLLLGTGLMVAVVMTAPLGPDVIERSAGAASRLDEWRVAATVVGDHPFLGVGPEGYRIAFAEGVDLEYEVAYGRFPLPDRAHSGPLDVATMAGIPAAALYVVLLGLVVWSSARVVHRGGAIAAGVALAAIAYVVQQLLLFPLAELDAVFWIAAGATMSGAGLFSGWRIDRLGARRTLMAAGGILLAAAAVAGVLDIAADRLAGRAVDTADAAAAFADAARAASLRPDVVRYHLVAAAAAEAIGTVRGIDDAVAATDRALNVSPGDPIARQRHARALLGRAEVTGDATDVTRAVDSFAALVAADPACFECQLGLGRAHALEGDAEAAERSWLAADQLTDDDTRPGTLLARLHEQQAGAE